MDDDVGAVLERLEKNRSGDCIVHYQRDTVSVRRLCKRFNIADIASRIPDRFAKNGLCIFVDQPLDRTRLVVFCEPPDDALPWQDVRQQCVGRPIQLRYRDNIATSVSKIYERVVQGGLTATNRERSDAAFKFGDAPLENSTCWVSDPTVAKALNFQIEQSGAVIGAIECVGCGLIYGDRDSLGGWIWLIATMYGNGLITHSNTRSVWPAFSGQLRRYPRIPTSHSCNKKDGTAR